MTPRLLERSAQLEVLHAALRRTTSRRGSNVIVRGEQGSGRTALLERFFAEVVDGRPGSAPTATGVMVTSTKRDAGSSLVVVQALLDRLDPDVPEVGEALDQVAAALRSGQPDPGPAVTRPVIAAVEAVVRASGRPLVIVIDDADWNDPDSGELFLRMAGRTRDLPVALVFSRLSVRRPTAEQAEIEVVREQLATDVVTLPPLTPQGARAWVAAEAPSLDPVSRDWLLAVSGRLPGRMAELAPALVARQGAPLSDSPWSELTTSRMRRAHLQVLDGLDDAQRRVLLLVGLAGVLRLRSLAGVADLPEAVDHADGLVRAEVLTEDLGALSLRDPGMLLSLLHDSTSADTRRAHADLASVLEGAVPPDVVLTHRIRGQIATGPEVGAELAAAAAALGVHRTARAAELYERAAALASDEQDRALWLVRSAEACWWGDRGERSAMLLSRVTAPAPGSPAQSASLFLQAQQAFSRREIGDALRLVEASLVAPDPRTPLRTLDALLLHRHLARKHETELPGAVDTGAVATAVAVLPAAEREVLAAEDLVHRPWAEVGVEERTRAFDKALERALTSTYPLLLPSPGAALVLTKHTELVRALRERWESMRSSSGALLQVDSLLVLASSEVEVLDTAGALERVRAVEELVSGWTPRARTTQRVLTATAALLTGASGAVEVAQGLAEELGPRLLTSACGPMLLWCLSEAERRAGDIEGAAAHLYAMHPPGSTPEQWCSMPVSSGNQAAFWSVASLVGLLARRGGEQAEIDALVAALEEWYELTGSTVAEHQLKSARSVLTDQPEEREAALVSTYDSAPGVFSRGLAALRLGEALRRQRRLVEARTHLQEAADVFERLRMTAYLERAVTEIAATAPQRPPRTIASTALTSQEQRVAQQAAAGLSNRQIAAALDISPRTVAHHLEAVYVKLSVSGRTELPDKLQPAE